MRKGNEEGRQVPEGEVPEGEVLEGEVPEGKEEEKGKEGEEGMVTVETAIGLMSVVMVLLAVLVALATGVAKGQACQVAREAARAASLGSISAPLGGGGRTPQVSVSESGNLVTAVASSPAAVLGQWRAPSVTCRVTGVREPYLQWSGRGG